MDVSLSFAHFLTQTDAVGKGVLAILVAMSVATWYLILVKVMEGVLQQRAAARFQDFFWNAPSLETVAEHLVHARARDPFARLAERGFVAVAHFGAHGGGRLADAGGLPDFLTRALRRAIDQETARLERGLTLLASVGSTAPFVGLFGTVWGVYHALVAIGLSGQGTLDRVAGPVGEALIMTALGLAVAIPGVLAYNAFTRSNRLVLAALDGFAHDLFAFLTTGERLAASGGEAVAQMPATRVAKRAS
jgi:biopolymer transport protein ExbB